MSAAWAWVQTRVARTTRVCSYDRAGLGWSEAGDTQYDPVAAAGQLRALLKRGGARGSRRTSPIGATRPHGW
jgi:hypothetical protein